MTPVVTRPPHFRGYTVMGDSQGLRFLLRHGVLPRYLRNIPFPRELGLCRSGLTVSGLLTLLEDRVTDNSLGDVLVFIGSNDLFKMCSAKEGRREMKRSLRGKLAKLRLVLLTKCKRYSRVFMLTVPPLPLLLVSRDDTEEEINRAAKARVFWSWINQSMMQLKTTFFRVVDITPYFMEGNDVLEELFERVMGRDRREDRIHINQRGMASIIAALNCLQ